METFSLKYNFKVGYFQGLHVKDVFFGGGGGVRIKVSYPSQVT